MINYLLFEEPVSKAFFAFFMLIDGIMVYRKSYLLEGIIGTVFSVLIMLTGFFGFLFGWVGILGSLLALAEAGRRKDSPL